MTQKHTPEPWYVFSHYGDPEIRTKDGDRLVAELLPSKIDDARRIVACVNASAGIPNEVLMTVGAFGGFGRDDMVRSVTAQRDDLQRELEQVKAAMKAQADGLVKQRDELVAVIENVSASLRRAGASIPAPENKGTIESAMATGLSIALVLVDEAIASVKGGAA